MTLEELDEHVANESYYYGASVVSACRGCHKPFRLPTFCLYPGDKVRCLSCDHVSYCEEA